MFTAHPVIGGTVPLLPLCRGSFLVLLQLQAEMNSCGHHHKFNHTISKAKLEQIEGRQEANTRRKTQVSFPCASMHHIFLIKTMQCLLLHANTTSVPDIKKSYTCLPSLFWGRKHQEELGNWSDTHLLFRDMKDKKYFSTHRQF